MARRKAKKSGLLTRALNAVFFGTEKAQKRRAAEAKLKTSMARTEARLERERTKAEKRRQKEEKARVKAERERERNREYVVNHERIRELEAERLRQGLPGFGKRKKKRTKRNPDLAQRESQAFHCEPDEVKRLSDKERKPLSKEVVVLGKLESVVYGPDSKSCRGDALYRHAFGDRGPGQPRAKEKPLLVADPKTHRIAIVQDKSPEKFDPRRGIVG